MNEVHFQPPTVIDNSNPELRVFQRVFEGPCYVHTMLSICQDLFSVPNLEHHVCVFKGLTLLKKKKTVVCELSKLALLEMVPAAAVIWWCEMVQRGERVCLFRCAFSGVPFPVCLFRCAYENVFPLPCVFLYHTWPVFLCRFLL